VTEHLQLIEGALVAAALYVLLGLGWNIVFTTCRYLNLAIGEFFVLAGVLSAKLPAWTGISTPWLVVPLVMVVVGVLALVVERLLVRPLGDREFGPLIVLVGVALVLAVAINELAPEIAVRSEDFVAGRPWRLGGVLVARQDAFVVGAAVLVAAAIYLFATRTDAGRTARACADDRGAAAALGIRVARIETWAFVVAMVVVALAAAVVTPTQGAAVGNGDVIALKAFLAVSLFGIGNHRGAVVGALGVALVEAYVTRYWSSDVRSLVVLGLLLVTLVAQPSLAHRRPRRPRRVGGAG
jgi:branched-chain amino acid transport system permease protein